LTTENWNRNLNLEKNLLLLAGHWLFLADDDVAVWGKISKIYLNSNYDFTVQKKRGHPLPKLNDGAVC
jgi:hypothetical protein